MRPPTSDEMLMTFCCTDALSVDSWPLDANHIYTPARTTRAGTIAKASGFSHGRDGRSGDRSSTATSSGGETSFSGSRRDCVFMPLHPDFRCASTWHREACRSEEHTSELQSLMRISYAVICLKKKKKN